MAVGSGGDAEEIMDIAPWDVSTIERNCRIVIVGKTESGKSTKIKWIMRSLGLRIRKGLVMTGSYTNRDYHDWVPEIYIHDGYDEQVIRNLNRIQECKIIESEVDPSVDPQIWYICDDMSDDKKVMGSHELEKLFARGRHKRVTSLVMVQYFRHLQKPLRPNIDYLILLNNKSADDRAGIHKQFISCVTLATFNQIFDQCTNNMGALVFCNNSKKNDARSCFRYLRIPDSEFIPDPLRGPDKVKLPPFRIGCKKYRIYSKRHFYDEVREQRLAVAEARKRERERAKRKHERVQAEALGAGSVANGGRGRVDPRRLMSIIGSDYKSSVLTPNASVLHSEPTPVGHVTLSGMPPLRPPTRSIRTTSRLGGRGGSANGGNTNRDRATAGKSGGREHADQIDGFSEFGSDLGAEDHAKSTRKSLSQWGPSAHSL